LSGFSAKGQPTYRDEQISPMTEPEDDSPDDPTEPPHYMADDPFVDDFKSDWFFDYSVKKQDLIGQLWATEREPVESASRTPIIPRIFGGSVMVLAVAAAAVLSSTGTVRRHLAPHPTPAAITMIFVPSGSPLWSSTFMRKRAGEAHHRHIIGRQAAGVFAAINAPKIVARLAELHPSAVVAATDPAAKRPLPAPQPNELPSKTASVASAIAIASQVAGSANVASSTHTYPHRPAPHPDNTEASTTAVPTLALAGKLLSPPHAISGQIDRQADAVPLAQSAIASVSDSLPSGNSIHLEISYSSRGAGSARSVAVLCAQLRSKVVGIESLNIRAGDARTSMIAYFFPSDRAGATAIAANLRQIAKQSIPVELLRRVPQPRPGTVELFVPSQNVKELSNAG
jgi:hypothetical protein